MQALVESVKPIVACWGPVTVAGNKPGLAQVLKLTNNILSAVSLAATCEAYVMGAKGGLDPEVMTEAINRGSGRNSATQSKFPTSVLNRKFDYGAPMHILAKDVDLAIEQGDHLSAFHFHAVDLHRTSRCGDLSGAHVFQRFCHLLGDGIQFLIRME